jgi:hypothetical protein
MLTPNKEEIWKACEVFQKSKLLAREAYDKISKLSIINNVFQEHFNKGFYEKSFIINESYFRVLYFGILDNKPLRVEECPPPGTQNKFVSELFSTSIYMGLDEFLYTFWPQGIYYIEKFLLDNE